MAPKEMLEALRWAKSEGMDKLGSVVVNPRSEGSCPPCEGRSDPGISANQTTDQRSFAAYREFAQAWRSAGVTEVAFALRGASAATHDRLVQTPGSFALLLRAIEVCRELGFELEECLLYRRQCR